MQQQQHLTDELTKLKTLLKERTIDKETWERYEKLLKIGYEKERELTREKYGFTNHSTPIN
jgi:hypothetical protein